MVAVGRILFGLKSMDKIGKPTPVKCSNCGWRSRRTQGECCCYDEFAMFCDCAWGMRDCDCDEHEVSYYQDPEYSELRAKVEVFMLKSRPETIIYTNGTFISETIQLKYQPLIDEKLQKNRVRQADADTNLHLLMEMKDIVRIVKFEIRYEPGECPDDYYLYFEEDEVDEDDAEEERPETEN